MAGNQPNKKRPQPSHGDWEHSVEDRQQESAPSTPAVKLTSLKKQKGEVEDFFQPYTGPAIKEWMPRYFRFAEKMAVSIQRRAVIREEGNPFTTTNLVISRYADWAAGPDSKSFDFFIPLTAIDSFIKTIIAANEHYEEYKVELADLRKDEERFDSHDIFSQRL